MTNKALFSTLFFLLGILLVSTAAWWNKWPPTIIAPDVRQERLNKALPMPRNGIEIWQRFYASRDGLREIELQFARYDPDDKGGQLLFRLVDDADQLVVEERLDTRRVTHNQIWNLRFPRQTDSEGRWYTLQISGNDLTPFSFWGYTLDVQAGALELRGATSEVQELRYVIRYELTVGMALNEVRRALRRDVGLFGLTLAFVLMPGALILLLARPWLGRWDMMAWWGGSLAIGLAFWPLCWYGLTLMGARWAGWGLWMVLGIGWLMVAGLWFWRRGFNKLSRRETDSRGIWSEWHGAHVWLGLILLGGLGLRLLAVRDLNFPLWVDSVRHGLIATLMAQKGQVLYEYAPLLPVERFPYHFGYHTLPASLLLMTEWALPRMMLSLGQLLNALVPLMVYTAAWLMTRKRAIGLMAAFLVAFPFLFPGYYATWGRFTQLTGMLIMPMLVSMTWLLVRGGKSWQRNWWLVALLAAGLFLVHLRVFIYYLPAPLVIWFLSKGRRSGALGAAGVVGGLLVAPRIWYLWPKSSLRGLSNTIAGYNEFPTGYLTAGWESYFLWVAGAGLCFVLLMWLLDRSWVGLPLILALWVGVLFLSLGGEYIGLPESWLINLNSMYITIFFPLALVLAISAFYIWREGKHFSQRWNLSFVWPLMYLPFGILLTLLLLFGSHYQITILNDQTILTRHDDLAALQWINENTPPDARFAVSSWPWLGGTWSATDGSAWLVPLTGRASSTPPADYIYHPPLAEEVKAFNEAASAIEDWSDPSVLDLLKTYEISYLFVGAKGGFLDPAALARNPGLVMRYQHNGAFVFAVGE